ncbi:MAG: hypothetical protein BRC51_05810, partial [Cyanobacteria bacterium SW_12_48_29]
GELVELKAEDDSGTIALDGEEISVEQASPDYPGYLLEYEPGEPLEDRPAVEQWQKQLEELGYDIGEAGVDGLYGSDTEAATIEFQKDKKIKVDGIVGPHTWEAAFSTDESSIEDGGVARTSYTIKSGDTLSQIAQDELGNSALWEEIKKENGTTFTEEEAGNLEVGEKIYLPDESPGKDKPDPSYTPYNATEIIKSKAVGEGIQKYAEDSVPLILNEAKESEVSNPAQIAYILATAEHESGLGKYMTEIASGKAYNGREDLGNTKDGDGSRFKGRGYVQLTGKSNYKNWSDILGKDLVDKPELAAKPKIAAEILVRGMQNGSFTGKKLSDYINAEKQDFVNARRIVNGTDKDDKIAQDAERYYDAIV